MVLVVVSSPKGGVGKTTLVANLAVALRRRGRNVTAVDFDSQNALRFLLAPNHESELGIARCTARGLPWSDAIVSGQDGVRVAPYGEATTAERLLMKDVLVEKALSEALASLARSPDEIVIVDTTPGEGRMQERLEALADLKLIVLLADAGSMALVPTYRGGLMLRPMAERPDTFGILNQVDPRRRLSRDIADFISAHAAERFIGVVHYDEALAEAAARGESVVGVAPGSVAAIDIDGIAASLDRLTSPGPY
ncbi:cellulose biosynthesis protein BcsQ [Caulobacter segnis]|uniref:cellulose biosynthesis protein BcsQ n=1 Tax=Caulobacter segnis TaxID=88688 RepID=UPI00285BC56F|nr:cellulose biosynthesis protein BcsQ [Caulobacter segnis]MDR6624061.1 cellulose synthase operon protein YhjQ [Caulobacter segnis]